jgi:hypothetical protein
MASDTVPAAVPGPGDPAGTTPTSNPAPEPRGLAGLLSAVDPARPTGFNLNPTTATGDSTETAVTGESSASYHGADTNSQTSNTKTSGNSGAGRQERSVIRAWLLAGAERWKQGGAARIKRLEMQKARHQAMQVKETRTVAVNRSGGILSGGSSASGGGKSGGGKSLNSKTSGGSSLKGPKNSPGASRNSSGGRSGGSGGSGGGSGAGTGAGRGSSGGNTRNGSSGRGNSGDGSSSKGSNGKNSSGSKTLKGDQSKPGGTSGSGSGGSAGSGGSKGGSSGGAGKTGTQGPAGRSGKDGSAPGTSNGKASTDNGPSATGSNKKPADSKDGAKKVDLEKKPGKKAPAKGADTSKASGKTTSPDKPGTKLTKTPAPGTGKRLNMQESRETGYRDGTRAATVAAHMGAWRDGVRDGWADTQKAATAEKHRLDQAHAQRKQQRAEDQPVTGASSADYHPTPTTPQQPGPQQTQATPVQVTSIDATHIALGDGAARTHISRGEVRTLKSFERRLTAKTDAMTQVADDTKVLKQHAEEQAKQITKLVEAAKAVKGGDKLIASLTKLEEAAIAQASKAEEIHKRALRAAEACKALLSNADTRYGDIYRAVVDSPETKPAEMDYYREMGVPTHA